MRSRSGATKHCIGARRHDAPHCESSPYLVLAGRQRPAGRQMDKEETMEIALLLKPAVAALATQVEGGTGGRRA